MGVRGTILIAFALGGGGAAPAAAADHALSWPVCCSTGSPVETQVDPNDTVTFSTVSPTQFSGHPLVWNFNDFTTTSTGTSRQFAFPTAGTYPFHCAIHSYMVGRIKVGADGHATPDFTVSSASVTVGDAVAFAYTGTPDPDGQILAWEWDFDGDGTVDQTTTGGTTTHSYPVAASFHPRLRVRDNGHELSTSATHDITVVAPAGAGSAAPPADPPPVVATIEGTAPVVAAPGTGDHAPPHPSGLRIRAGRLRMRLNERAILRGSIVRNTRPVRSVRARLPAGPVAWRLPRHLARGRYTLRFRLTDAVGNRSRLFTVGFRVSPREWTAPTAPTGSTGPHGRTASSTRAHRPR